MLKLVWFIGRPVTDIEAAEALYQDQHVRRGMRQENLRSFRISRAVCPQPEILQSFTGAAIPPVFRFSEGYWDSLEDIEECYRSPHGLAALADGMLNASPRAPDRPLPVLLAEEERLPAAGTLGFDIFSGRFVDERPRKLFVFIELPDPASSRFDQAYADLASTFAADRGIGPHVLSRTQEYRLELGRSRQWPPDGAEHYHRIVELYFAGPDVAESFFRTDTFQSLMGLVRSCSASFLPILVEPQHVFFTTTGQQPLSEGWIKAFEEAPRKA